MRFNLKAHGQNLLTWHLRTIRDLVPKLLLLLTTMLYAQDYKPGEVIVYLNPVPQTRLNLQGNTPPIAFLKTQYDVQHIQTYTFKNPGIANARFGLASQPENQEVAVIQVNPDTDIEALSQTLSKDPRVAFAEPNYTVHLFEDASLNETPQDPYFNQQTYIQGTDLRYVWGIPAQHEVLVAIVDTGVDYTHEDLQHAIYTNPNEIVNGLDDDGNGVIDDIQGANFYGASSHGPNANSMDEHSHGTHLSGIIAADANNQKGITGINPRAKILPINFLDKNGSGTQFDAALALRYAVDMGAKVINCSWGYFKKTQALEDAITYAINKGVIVVAAVGNSNTPLQEYPAALPGVMTIGSVDLYETRSYFSSYGTHLDYMIYGEDIYSAYPGNHYGTKSGTSQSTAIVTGIVSRLLAYDDRLTQTQIYDLLTAASSLGNTRDLRLGHGIIDAYTLLNQIDASLAETIQTQATDALAVGDVMNFPNPFNDAGTRFGFECDQENATAKVQVFDLTGQQVRTLEQSTVNGYNTLFFDGLSNTGKKLLNGTYIYVVSIQADNLFKVIKGKCTVLR